MRHLDGDQLNALFSDFRERAFHLETAPSYAEGDDPEAEAFRKWQAGIPDDDDSWYRPWDDMIRGITSSGRKVQRVRVVSVPHSHYVEFSMAFSVSNIAAGEDIRWLPSNLVDAADAVTDDFWLFDEALVAFTLFDPDGNFAGAATSTDARIIDYAVGVRDRLWEKAIPHVEYVRRQ